jgi:hypothetical protein
MQSIIEIVSRFSSRGPIFFIVTATKFRPRGGSCLEIVKIHAVVEFFARISELFLQMAYNETVVEKGLPGLFQTRHAPWSIPRPGERGLMVRPTCGGNHHNEIHVEKTDA